MKILKFPDRELPLRICLCGNIEPLWSRRNKRIATCNNCHNLQKRVTRRKRWKNGERPTCRHCGKKQVAMALWVNHNTSCWTCHRARLDQTSLRDIWRRASRKYAQKKAGSIKGGAGATEVREGAQKWRLATGVTDADA